MENESDERENRLEQFSKCARSGCCAPVPFQNVYICVINTLKQTSPLLNVLHDFCYSLEDLFLLLVSIPKIKYMKSNLFQRMMPLYYTNTLP